METEKKESRWWMWLALLLFAGAVFFLFAGCSDGNGQQGLVARGTDARVETCPCPDDSGAPGDRGPDGPVAVPDGAVTEAASQDADVHPDGVGGSGGDGAPGGQGDVRPDSGAPGTCGECPDGGGTSEVGTGDRDSAQPGADGPAADRGTGGTGAVDSGPAQGEVRTSDGGGQQDTVQPSEVTPEVYENGFRPGVDVC